MKKKIFQVIRTVKEIYIIEAINKHDALLIAGIDGNPTTITVIKETAKIKKQYAAINPDRT